MLDRHSRRDFLKTSALAAFGSAAALNARAGLSLAAPAGVPAMPQTFHHGFPTGKLGNLNVTRLFLGCNQVSGYSHSRDLGYVSSLMREYQTDERVMDTWQLAEELGINTVLSDPFDKPVRIMKRYRQERGGKMQWISEVHPHASHTTTSAWRSLERTSRKWSTTEPTRCIFKAGLPTLSSTGACWTSLARRSR